MASIAPPASGLGFRLDPGEAGGQVEPVWSRAVGIGLVGLLLVAFVGSGWWRFTAPFGDSHDGSNGGVWVDTARAIVEQGPAASHLGSRLLTGGVYAHHPPLIAWLTALTDWAGGESPFADRLPVIVGALACIGLLVFLLRGVGLEWIAIAGGVGTALATPLFFVYGPMLDTLPLSLPIGIAFLVVWRRRVAREWGPGWLLATVAALCVLASWEAALLVAIAALASCVLGRRDGNLLRHLIPVFVGAAIGAVVLASWLLWASGSFGPLLQQLEYRSGRRTPLGLGDSLEEQWRNLGLVMGFARWLLLPAAVAGLCHLRTRLTMSVLVPTVVIYPVVLREAATHDFWNLWLVAPLAIGLAAAIDLATRRARTGWIRPLVTAMVTALVALSLAQTVVRDPKPAQLFRLGLGAAHALDRANPHGPFIYVILPRDLNTNWIALRTGARIKPIGTPHDLIIARQLHPDASILLDCDQLNPVLTATCRRSSPDRDSPRGGAYTVTSVASFADQALGPVAPG